MGVKLGSFAKLERGGVRVADVINIVDVVAAEAEDGVAVLFVAGVEVFPVERC